MSLPGGIAVYGNSEKDGPTVYWRAGRESVDIDVPALHSIQYVPKWGMLAAEDSADDRLLRMGPSGQPVAVLSDLSLARPRESFSAVAVAPSGTFLVGRTDRLGVLNRPLTASAGWTEISSRTEALRLPGVLGSAAQEYDVNCAFAPNEKWIAVSFPTRRYLYEAAGDREADTFVRAIKSGEWSKPIPGVPLGWLTDEQLVVRDRKTDSVVLVDRTGKVLQRKKLGLAVAVGPSISATVESSGPDRAQCRVSLWSGFFEKRIGRIDLALSSHTILDSELAVWALK